VLSTWQYLGSGYLNPGDVLLAAAVEASLRVAREALLDLRRGWYNHDRLHSSLNDVPPIELEAVDDYAMTGTVDLSFLISCTSLRTDA
jgi:hypothetical protein